LFDFLLQDQKLRILPIETEKFYVFCRFRSNSFQLLFIAPRGKEEDYPRKSPLPTPPSSAEKERRRKILTEEERSGRFSKKIQENPGSGWRKIQKIISKSFQLPLIAESR